jgi:hypothetical protein
VEKTWIVTKEQEEGGLYVGRIRNSESRTICFITGYSESDINDVLCSDLRRMLKEGIFSHTSEAELEAPKGA